MGTNLGHSADLRCAHKSLPASSFQPFCASFVVSEGETAEQPSPLFSDAYLACRAKM
jgi:hypothetical protein